MKCPTTDKLSQYVDDLLVEVEHIEIDEHISSCIDCKRVVETFRTEQLFLKETLRTPTLPDDFSALVLDKLEPYEQKVVGRKQSPWKRIIVSAAGIVIAFGLTATFNPSFAAWIGGLFGTEQVDEGFRMAADEGLTIRVNQEVTDNGFTLKIEDVVADSSRVALSYQIFNSTGKMQDIQLDFVVGSKNNLSVVDQNGNNLEIASMGWSSPSDYDYGYVELSLREHEPLEKVTVKFNIDEIDGIQGNWDIEIPVDLKESLKLTTIHPLKDAEISVNGVEVKLNEAKFSPSTNEIIYETGFTQDELDKINNEIKFFKEKFGNEKNETFMQYETAIGYHIEDEAGKAIAHKNSFFEGKGHPRDSGLLQGFGQDSGVPGKFAWNEFFIPYKSDPKLTFVLDGVFKTVPSDFSIKIKPNELKKTPVSFEYEGNFITIKNAKVDNKNSLGKALNSIEKESFFQIEMEGGRKATADQFGNWVVVDNKGKIYEVNCNDSILDEKDNNNLFKTTIELEVHDLKEMPEELTLYLVSVKRYEELKKKWKVPLY